MTEFFYKTIAIIFIFFAFSCKQNSNKERAIKAMKNSLKGYENIVGESEIMKGKTTKASDFITIKVPHNIEDSILHLANLIEKVRYVKLETSSEHVIGTIDKLYFSQDRIIVVDKRKAQAIFIFDQSGKYISKINQKGRGPGEFNRISDACYKNDSGEIVVFDDSNNRCSYYSSIDGKFIKSERTAFFFMSFEYLKDDLFIHTLYPGANPHIPMIDYNNVVVSKNCKKIVSTFRPNYTPFPKIEAYESLYSLTHSNSASYFTPLFSDTTFQIKSIDMALEATFCINFEKDDLIYSMKKEASRKEFFNELNMGNLYLFEGKILVLGNYIYYDVLKGNRYGGFYSKVSKQFRGGGGYSSDDFPDIEYFSFPVAVAGSEFVSILEPSLIMMAEENRKKIHSVSKKSKSDKISKLLSSMSDLDNPVLIFYTLKDF